MSKVEYKSEEYKQLSLEEKIQHVSDEAEKFIQDGSEDEEYEKGVKGACVIIKSDLDDTIKQLKNAIVQAEKEQEEINEGLNNESIDPNSDDYEELEIRDISNTGFLQGLNFALNLLKKKEVE